MPSTSCPPRVPKLLAAIVYKLEIVDYRWVAESLAAKKAIAINNYKMDYLDTSSLFAQFKI